jgi:hypothetical protein
MNSSETQPAAETGHDSVRVRQIVAYAAVLIALGAVLSVGVAGAQADAGTQEPAADAVVVELDETGDAVVTVKISFDRTVDDERSDFEAFVESEEKQQAQLDQYESRLSDIAAEVAAQTGREMSVTNPSIETRMRNDGDLGLVVLTATWEGLAASDGSQLVLGPPFDSGFNTDQTVVVRPPAQHQVVSSTPTPVDGGEQLVWNDDQSLEEFEVVVEPLSSDAGDGTDDTSGDDTSGDGTSGDDTSGDDTSGDDTSGDGTSGDDTSGDGTSGDDTSGDDASGPGFGVLVVLLGFAGLRVWTWGE